MHVWIYYYSTGAKGTNYIYVNLTRGKYNVACTNTNCPVLPILYKPAPLCLNMHEIEFRAS